MRPLHSSEYLGHLYLKPFVWILLLHRSYCSIHGSSCHRRSRDTFCIPRWVLFELRMSPNENNATHRAEVLVLIRICRQLRLNLDRICIGRNRGEHYLCAKCAGFSTVRMKSSSIEVLGFIITVLYCREGKKKLSGVLSFTSKIFAPHRERAEKRLAEHLRLVQLSTCLISVCSRR